ncbi:hypothetical protein L227DRAFT_574471 [Lentinus tigrinus ALCF2SS1-6]|uniref:Uncharacterized protein n=1 Tax=Lentinus tigrinus ALCF2SS1-6 TaxID=1328759 RepID=A0A5C2SCA7_9APHY|nr:hypothetical protein L227DRAFT_574471 [Lentinus tigrinus ALCF2SS1-6]
MEHLPQLTCVQCAFFEKLDEELDEVKASTGASGTCGAGRIGSQSASARAPHPSAVVTYHWIPLPLPAPLVPRQG